MRILVTGGAGYIGAHASLELCGRGHDVVIVDDFSNSTPEVLPRLEQLAGRPIACVQLDLRNRAGLDALFARHAFDAVLHFAALKAVGESCEKPLEYFDNNVSGTLVLLQAMKRARVAKFVFSSSATVYGAPDSVPVREDAPLRVTNPYGRSKLVVEQLLGDISANDPGFHVASLRYFNPVGAHASGMIGEDPAGIPNNLMPYICQVATGRREWLSVFGDDYPTPDGSGVRDYIHVVDLARAHADAIDYLLRERRSLTVNLGTGRGVSVLELVRAFEKASGRPVPYRIAGRRAGDVAEVYADPALAHELLGWRAELDIDAMCRDAWNWQSRNPMGYRTAEAA